MAAVKVTYRADLSGQKKLTDPKTMERVLFKVGLRAIHFASTTGPKPPIDWGVLRGAGNVATRNQNQFYDGPGIGRRRGRGKKATPTRPDLSGIPRNGVRISFNTVYAMKLHEATPEEAESWPSKLIDADVGPGWIAPMKMRRARLDQLTAEFLRDEIRMAAR